MKTLYWFVDAIVQIGTGVEQEVHHIGDKLPSESSPKIEKEAPLA